MVIVLADNDEGNTLEVSILRRYDFLFETKECQAGPH